MIDIVGYVASAFLVAGMAMHKELKLKSFFLAGQILWIVYASILGLLPILILNVVMVTIAIKDIFQILRRRHRHES